MWLRGVLPSMSVDYVERQISSGEGVHTNLVRIFDDKIAT